MVTPLLLLALGAPPPPHSVLLDESFRVGPLLQEMPAADSLAHLFEHLVQPVIVSLEENAGFSDVDPAKLSIYGDSWVWNEWYFDGFNLTDPLYPGAAALSVPFALLGAFDVVYAENPSSALRQGIALWSDREVHRTARATLRFPDAGGTFPGAEPLVDAISTRHAANRSPPPPAERRRFGEGYQLALVDREQLSVGDLTLAIAIDDGSRRFLDFTEPEGAFAGVFEERYLIASAAALLAISSDTRLTVLGEYRSRDRAFAELHYDPKETFTSETAGAMVGVTHQRLQVALTLKGYQLEANQLGFTRDLFDPDGEALAPFHPAGTYGAAKLEASWSGELLYFSLINRAVAFSPSATEWTNPLLAGGRDYGAWRWQSAPTALFLGEERLGLRERLALGAIALSYDLYLDLAFAANRSGTNSVVFADVGVEIALEHGDAGRFRPVLTLAKTPIAPSIEVAQRLDPLYLDGRLTLADGRLIDTTGGAHTTVARGTAMTNVYSLGLGTSIVLGDAWSLGIQGILKTYRDTYRYTFDGGPERNGSFTDGVYFLDEGEKRYLLGNAERDQPLYFGAHFELVGLDPKSWVVSIGFSMYNAVGYPPLGNGPLANDIGLADPTTANPNTAINQQANLDGDRGFHFKALLGYRFFDRLWAFLSIRHRDGQPFAFLDAREHQGQIALVQSSKRGSPLKIDRPLAGPREDFHLDFTAKLSLELTAHPLALRTSLLAANLLDLGNELQERNGPARPTGRPALEQQIPRSFLLTLEASY